MNNCLFHKVKGYVIADTGLNSDLVKTFTKILKDNQGLTTLGYFAAIKKDDGYSVGFSICDPYEYFNFSKKLGRSIALGKAEKSSDICKKFFDNRTVFKSTYFPFYILRYSLRSEYEYFINRCKRYFKTDKDPENEVFIDYGK